LTGRLLKIDLERPRSEIQATRAVLIRDAAQVLQQCKREGRIHSEFLRCFLYFFAEVWTKASET
jgi:hypothetical protein